MTTWSLWGKGCPHASAVGCKCTLAIASCVGCTEIARSTQLLAKIFTRFNIRKTRITERMELGNVFRCRLQWPQGTLLLRCAAVLWDRYHWHLTHSRSLDKTTHQKAAQSGRSRLCTRTCMARSVAFAIEPSQANARRLILCLGTSSHGMAP